LSHEVRSNFDEVDVEHEVAAWTLETGVKDGLGKVGSDLDSVRTRTLGVAGSGHQTRKLSHVTAP
jgi:hypothetical protein